MTSNRNKQGFDTIALHGGYSPDPTVQLGLGQGAPTGTPVYRTTPYKFKDTEHAANLFKLKELGNIYSRIVSTAVLTLRDVVIMLANLQIDVIFVF